MHECKFELLPIDWTPSFFDSRIVFTERFITRLELLFKGQKKAKPVKQCRVCGKYLIECPYCKEAIESVDYPVKMNCPHCGKEFQVRWDY